MVLVSVAAFVTCMPLQPTGRIADSYEKALISQEPDAKAIETETASLAPYEIECQDELAVCMNSVGQLSAIVLDECEKPHHDFELASWDNARSGVYNEDGFNCVDFSDMLVEKLNAMGYNARVAHGYYKGEPHAWVVAEIPIEATSGNLISPQYYADYAEKSG